MSSSRARQIEAWFRDHEKWRIRRRAFLAIFRGGRRSFYCANGHLHYQALLPAHKPYGLEVVHPVLIVGRYGLPIPSDLIHLNYLPVGTNCWFVGDADPPCILTFAWLRAHAAIGWLGINDELLNRNPASDRARLEIEMSDAEKMTMPVLPSLCPDFRGFLGPQCCEALARGIKIELEGAMMHPHSGTVT